MPVVYRFPFIRPLVPPVESWSGYLEAAYTMRWFSNHGPVVQQFESALTRRFCHSGEIMTSANNATSAIAATLISVGARGTVLLPAFTFPATASAVVMAGANPRVLDVDRHTWCLSIAALEAALRSEKCDAVVLVAPFGIQQDFARYADICRQNKTALVIDNAAGLGASEMPLGNEGCFEIYSLHASKAFPVGEGGAIRSFASHAESLRRAINFGLQDGKPRSGSWGINAKMPEISAAVGLAVLANLKEVLARRRAMVRRYMAILQDFDEVEYPRDVDRAPWQVFPVLLSSADVAEGFLLRAAEKGLHVRRGYHPTLEDWPGTRKMVSCRTAQSLSERMICLPVYSDGTEEEETEMADIVHQALEEISEELMSRPVLQ
ncbi:MAG: DegT/DnrJ/EryC1/StrS family aminotransferase [Chthoniobacterales bacterium]